MAEKKSATAKEEKAAQAAEQTAADQAAKNAEEPRMPSQLPRKIQLPHSSSRLPI